jgi:GNAT superfamily N-acetyltransferase
LRAGRAADASEGGRIAYQAFAKISREHGFPPDFPSVDVACGLLRELLVRTDLHSVVAERAGRVVGSNFLWEGDPIAGVGPITVDPAVQNGSIGRRLMRAVLDRAEERKAVGVRLVQAAYHSRSLALYSRLGFSAREPLSLLKGPVPEVTRAHRTVRIAQFHDAEACDVLAARLLGHARGVELRHAISQQQARVAEHDGRITGYTTGIGFFGHSVGESNEDVQALVGAASEITGPGLLLPTRNAALLRWCLAHGLRIVQPMTLMSRGEYREPAGAYLPSILY